MQGNSRNMYDMVASNGTPVSPTRNSVWQLREPTAPTVMNWLSAGRKEGVGLLVPIKILDCQATVLNKYA